MEKIQDGDETINDEEALDYALHAKNMETTTKGFSPYQIVYGCNPNIPGITNATPASFEEHSINEDIAKHMKGVNLARESFRKVDNDERIKRALKSRIQISNQRDI